MSRESHIQYLKNGISGYGDMQNEILDAVKDNDNQLDQETFDEIFHDFGPLKARRIKGSNFILGDLYGGENSKYIHLVQIMVDIGIIKTGTNKNGLVYYSKT